MTLTRIDCHALGGVAGDMFAAAMFDAYPQLFKPFQEDLALLGIDGLQASLEKRTSNGLSAQYFSVEQQTELKPPRTLPAVINFLNSKSLDTSVSTVAIDIYRLLAHAEATVHGTCVDTVHFHEVSDWDSMVDILAAAGIITRLQCPRWRIGPLPLGGGTIQTAHGEIPLPAPATLQLLKTFDWVDDGQAGERVTPTGAAILAYLQPEKSHSKTTAAQLSTTGIGCGTRKLADRANIFRVCSFDQHEEASVQTDLVACLAFEVDDMSAEEIAQAMDILRLQRGVLDVTTMAMQGKKGRQSTGVRLIVRPESSAIVTDQCFRQTSTLGVRCMDVQRKTLHRHSTSVEGYDVKTALRPTHKITAKIESAELEQLPTLQERRTLASRIEQIATDD